jgi:thioredoxin 1
MNETARNLAILVLVVGVVAGVAVFKATRDSGEGPAEAVPAPEPASVDEVADNAPPPPETPASVPTTTPVSAEPATQPTTGLPRMVDLGADKCIPCKKMAPILVELRAEYTGRAVIDFIDVWKDPDAGQEYNIRLIPTQIFFDRKGKEVWRHEGFLPKEDIVAKLKELGA